MGLNAFGRLFALGRRHLLGVADAAQHGEGGLALSLS